MRKPFTFYYTEPVNPPIIAAIGFSCLFTGSASTPKFSRAVAPSRNRELSPPAITGQMFFSCIPSISKLQYPNSFLSVRPSANNICFVPVGAKSIFFEVFFRY
jgi:hypothetical protein